MSKDAIERILGAEEKAAARCADAERQAEEIRREARRQAEALRAAREREAEDDCARMLEKVRLHAEAMKTQKAAETAAEVEALRAAARERMPAAVDAIVRGIVEACR